MRKRIQTLPFPSEPSSAFSIDTVFIWKNQVSIIFSSQIGMERDWKPGSEKQLKCFVLTIPCVLATEVVGARWEDPALQDLLRWESSNRPWLLVPDCNDARNVLSPPRSSQIFPTLHITGRFFGLPRCTHPVQVTTQIRLRSRLCGLLALSKRVVAKLKFMW